MKDLNLASARGVPVEGSLTVYLSQHALVYEDETVAEIEHGSFALDRGRARLGPGRTSG